MAPLGFAASAAGAASADRAARATPSATDRRNLISATGGDGGLPGAVRDRAGGGPGPTATDGHAAGADVGSRQRIRADWRGLRVRIAVDLDAGLGDHVLGFGLPVAVHVLRVPRAAVALLLVADAAAAAVLRVPVLGRV